MDFEDRLEDDGRDDEVEGTDSLCFLRAFTSVQPFSSCSVSTDDTVIICPPANELMCQIVDVVLTTLALIFLAFVSPAIADTVIADTVILIVGGIKMFFLSFRKFENRGKRICPLVP